MNVRLFLTVVLSALVFAGMTMAQNALKQAFSADPKVRAMTEAYSLDAVDHAKAHFGIELDWSERSVEAVEQLLAQMNRMYVGSNPRPSEEEISAVAKAYGSYVGEVYRRHHGAEWGTMTIEGGSFPAVQAKSGAVFWPIGKALKRIKDGPAENIAFYYRGLLPK
ncbi:hypothetical protein [Bosea sp. CS1GBMeth4]|uniref:hypothetical protein n=1 Tax=Bosea sp. CS1GBMeth4 TaxID=1892849 RepID=UPI001644B3CB|nr:hypothetical protein [Bosea sp. CS1GBMeth4]